MMKIPHLSDYSGIKPRAKKNLAAFWAATWSWQSDLTEAVESMYHAGGQEALTRIRRKVVAGRNRSLGNHAAWKAWDRMLGIVDREIDVEGERIEADLVATLPVAQRPKMPKDREST